MSELINTSVDGRVLTITMNRPAQKNALTQEMYGAIADALNRLDSDDQLRAAIITGAGDAYTAGNDIMDFAQGDRAEELPVVRFLHAIRDTEKPLIAAVNGVAVGVGLTMLLHCDLVFASEAASFRAPFPYVGVVPEAGSSLLLPQAVGNAWANDLVLGGRTLTAQEALQIGLISRLYPGETLIEETMKTAQTIAAQAPEAMKKSKRLIRSNRPAVAERMQEEGVLFAEQLASPEFAECAAAFMQKRPPKFD